MMLHTKYQGSRPSGFNNKICLCVSLCKTCDPGAEPFWLIGHNLNKLDRGLQGDVTY